MVWIGKFISRRERVIGLIARIDCNGVYSFAPVLFAQRERATALPDRILKLNSRSLLRNRAIPRLIMPLCVCARFAHGKGKRVLIEHRDGYYYRWLSLLSRFADVFGTNGF